MEMNDDETMMDQIASEAMDAIERKDKDVFLSSMHALLSDLVNKMNTPQEESES